MSPELQSARENLFSLASMYLDMRRKSGSHLNNFLFGSFPVSLPNRPDIERVMVTVSYGQIKEIAIYYKDGAMETLRKETQP